MASGAVRLSDACSHVWLFPPGTPSFPLRHPFSFLETTTEVKKTHVQSTLPPAFVLVASP